MSTTQKFTDAKTTVKGDTRAYVDVSSLETLWFNTGSQCNIECQNCYMESSPTNDSLIYLSKENVLSYVDEGLKISEDLKTIGFTGGEPFLNKDMVAILEGCLSRGLKVLVLSNAMKPLANKRSEIKALADKYQDKLVIRVSLDHHSEEGHDKERGEGSFSIAIKQLQGLSIDGIQLTIAGRSLYGESLQEATAAYHKLFSDQNIKIQEAGLILFPEMDLDDEKSPEITTECWSILNKDPNSLMCATSRMVIHKKGDDKPSVAACTLLPYDDFFNYGSDLKKSLRRTYLKHVYCSQFCALGSASCSG